MAKKATKEKANRSDGEGYFRRADCDEVGVDCRVVSNLHTGDKIAPKR